MKIPLQKLLPLALIGFSAGLCNGLLGAGGGILIVFGLQKCLHAKLSDPRTVYACAIAVMLPLSLFSAIRYIRLGHFSVPSLPVLIAPAIVGGILGALLLKRLKTRLLSLIFAAVVLLSGVLMVI